MLFGLCTWCIYLEGIPKYVDTFVHYFLEVLYIYIHMNAHKQSSISAADFSSYIAALLQETAQFVTTLGSFPVPDNPVQLC